eukprot:7264141-Ditylum_brightwellii.AAC.1
MDDAVVNFKIEARSTIIDATFKELGDAVQHCSVPDKDSLLSATKENPLGWNSVSSSTESLNQDICSFEEQQFAIFECAKTVDNDRIMWRQISLTKSF